MFLEVRLAPRPEVSPVPRRSRGLFVVVVRSTSANV